MGTPHALHHQERETCMTAGANHKLTRKPEQKWTVTMTGWISLRVNSDNYMMQFE